MPVILQLFYKVGRKVTPPNPFHEASTSLIPKLDTDTTEKENYHPVSSMNVYAKLNKILANQIQKRIKQIVYLHQAGSSSGMQGWFNTCKPGSAVQHLNRHNVRNNSTSQSRKITKSNQTKPNQTVCLYRIRPAGLCSLYAAEANPFCSSLLGTSRQ